MWSKITKLFRAFNNEIKGYCPYCKVSLDSCSGNVLIFAVHVTRCPFCGKKIYGIRSEDGVDWTSEHPFKMAAIILAGAIVVTVIGTYILINR